jgi:hypothetical protein
MPAACWSMRESTSSSGEHVKLEPHFVVKPFYRYEQMGIEMNKAFLLAACCFIGACSSGYHPLYYFNEVQVVNLSGEEIRDVSLRVVDSGKRLDCEEVAKFAMCHDRFGRKRYPQQGLELSWTQADGSRGSDTPNPHVPAYFSPSLALRIVIEIGQDGSVKAFYEQEEPGRGTMFDI